MQREYKAVHTEPAPSHITESRKLLSQIYGPRTTASAPLWVPFDNHVADHLKLHREVLLHNAREKLREQFRQSDLLNVYLHWNEEADTISATYVFGNRDTALMFKLSL